MPPATVFYPSPYLCIGTEEFENTRGKRVVPVFRTSDAKMLTVSTSLANLLKRESFTAEELSSAQREALLGARLVCTDPQEARKIQYDHISDTVDAVSARTFVLFPTSYCNMGCAYCGQEHLKGGMTKDHRASVMRRVSTAIRSGISAVDIRWFGGEPLMAFAVLRSMSREFIAEADAAGVAYRSNIVTNGSLLDERKLRSLVDECRVSTLHITIDGPQEVHDRHRPLKSGGRSFERLVSFLADATADPHYANTRFVLRTNVDVENSDYVDEYFQLMADRGFGDRNNVQFSLVAVHPWSNDVSKLEISKREFAAKEMGWLRKMTELGLNCQLLPSARKPIPCGAITREAEVIGSNGSMFSCTEQPLVPEHESNSVLVQLSALPPDELRPAGQFDDWPTTVRQGEVPCSRCWMLPICGGHCPKAWSDGDIPCPSSKINMPDRLALEARRLGLVPAGAAPAVVD